jgi:hypothetical protein
LLFRLFVEQSQEAKELANYYAEISNVDFIARHGKPDLSTTILDGDDRFGTPTAFCYDELREYDRWLQENNRRVWLLYDELDAGFGFNQTNYDRRRRAEDG